MSAVPVPAPLPIPRYPLWQPAAGAAPSTPGSHHLPGADSRRAATLLNTSQGLFPFHTPSPLPLHHLSPALGPQSLRVPIPLHQLPRPFHPPHPQPHPHHHHHHHHPHDQQHHQQHLDPLPTTPSTVHLTKAAERKDQDTPSLGLTAPMATTACALLHSALPFPAEIRRPLPPVYNFTPADLDTVLYGYVRASREPPCGLGCALSGLRLQETDQGRKTPVCTLPPPCGKDARADTDGPDSEKAPSGKDGEKPTSRPLLDFRTVNLPEGISITQTTVGGFPHYSVFCHATVIPKGSRFGPFTGRIIHPSEIKRSDDTNYMWEIFRDGKLSHFVDGRNGASNWLCFVNCARHAQEQNLIATQSGDYIYYEACKDIPKPKSIRMSDKFNTSAEFDDSEIKGTELLVWYGDSYGQFMGIPVSLKGTAAGRNQTENENLQSKEGYKCDRCGKVFSYKDYRDKHLKYTRCVDKGDRKFPCHMCTRSFEKRDRLRIHILHVHQKHRPHKCAVCGKSFSQSSSLNKHIRVHSGERPYKCVYCSKAFTASSILRTHIRQHSGEKPFKCKHCGKAFASHAAHDSHVRRTHTKDKPCACPVCGKAFSQNYELKFHMNIHPEADEKPYDCQECGRGFTSAAARDLHRSLLECRRHTPLGSHATHDKDVILE